MQPHAKLKDTQESYADKLVYVPLLRFFEETGPGLELNEPTLEFKAKVSIKAGLIPQINVYLW